MAAEILTLAGLVASLVAVSVAMEWLDRRDVIGSRVNWKPGARRD